MKSQPLLLLRPLPPLETHEEELRAMPLLEAREDQEDAMIELAVLVLLLLAACVAGWWMWS